MINWKFYSNRRKISLNRFVKGAKNYPDALRIFENARVEPPLDGSLQELFKHSENQNNDTIVEKDSPSSEVTEPEVSTTEEVEDLDEVNEKKTPKDFGIREKTSDQ